MHFVEEYFQNIREVRVSGNATVETSYYPALEKLLTEVGHTLKPKIKPVLQLKDYGAGLPDGGLFSQDQLKKPKSGSKPDFATQLPSRGAVEIKSPGADLDKVQCSEQVAKYLQKYGQVLLTNLREFRIIRQKGGTIDCLERITLASSESAFWSKVDHPKKSAVDHGVALAEFLQRAMLYPVPVTSPESLARFLASYARDALAAIQAPSKVKPLAELRKALEDALGLKFEGEKGEHFFRSTLVQTLFYGLFSAWVLWCREPGRKPSERFNWKEAVWSLQVPMIQALYARLAHPGELEPLGLVHLLDLTGETLNRVERPAFFKSFDEGTAVQYFYEPFLQAFDPELRKDLGVWYTPREIVRYMVERVDQVLRSELGIASGLADPNVYVLDPACGTGAYLVEVLDRIHRTLLEQSGGDALTPGEVKRAATSRVFGFEILPAPFVISHLQLGLQLQRMGAPLAEKNDGKERERAQVFLTNALTGWEPPDEAKKQIELIAEFKREREAADEIKRDKPILVILGNPPYNAFAGVSPAEEDGLVLPYKEGLVKEWGIKKFNLDDLYVRFFRIAERRIAERPQPGKGVVCFISNMSWVAEPSFVVLRKHLLSSFNKIWIDNLHGNRKITEYAPDGRTSETIFAISGLSAGIQQGVATTLWVRTGQPGDAEVLFRDDINEAKAEERRAHLLATLESAATETGYAAANPTPSNRFSFRPSDVSDEYLSWPRIVDLCAEPPSNGLMEKRGGALVDIDKAALTERMRLYLDRDVKWEEFVAKYDGPLAKPAARFDAASARKKIQKKEAFNQSRLVRYALRPFDTRWCYYTGIRPVWNEPRPRLWEQVFEGNSFILTRAASSAQPEGFPISFTRLLSDDHYLTPDAAAVPMSLAPDKVAEDGHLGWIGMPELLDQAAAPNLSAPAAQYAAGIAAAAPNDSIYMHVLAVGYSPLYLAEHADGIAKDWPRIPLPDSSDLLAASAQLGRQVADLLDTEAALEGVTEGMVRQEFKSVAVLGRLGGAALKPEDLELRAGWGHPGKEGVTMPGKGKVSLRDYTPVERAVILAGAKRLGLTEEQALGCLGEQTCNIWLNDDVIWHNVPQRVWEFTIGGYQVMKKWLSYRELKMLGRALTEDEAREVRNMARRLAALCLLQPALDDNYRRVKANCFPWPQLAQKQVHWVS